MDAEVVIAGGGLVGTLTAVMLAERRPDWRIIIVEPGVDGPAPDKRYIALAAASAKRLQQIGVFNVSDTHMPIKHIHISDRGFIGATELHADEEGIDALGVVSPAADIVQALYQRCLKAENVTWVGGCRVTDIEQQQDLTKVTLSDDRCLQTQLLVGADGQHSFVREHLGLPSSVEDYGQIGCIASITLDRPLSGWAYERFTENGPVALLPMPNNQASLVWTFTEQAAAEAEQWDDQEFLSNCQQAFGYRAGEFMDVSPRVFYPLKLRRAQRSIHHRCVIVGNASHALHPIAGQGFNLGLRDVEVLTELLAETDDAGAFSVLSSYQQRREKDYNAIISLTDLLVRGFSNHYWPMIPPRNLALLGLHHLKPLKSAFARLTMGMKI